MEETAQHSNNLVSVILVEAPIDMVWKHWIRPESIKQWNVPFDDWHCPEVTNDFREGGRFNFRMEQKNSQDGFNYSGIYTRITTMEYIESDCGGRSCVVEFRAIDNNTIIREIFEPDPTTPLDVQQNFTDSVLLNFKNFVESSR